MATRAKASPVKDVTAEVAYLTRALKVPTLRDCVDRLAERARAEGWSNEEYLVACLQREVAARDTHGGEGRIKTARFPARKSLEEFEVDYARGLKRDRIAHPTPECSCERRSPAQRYEREAIGNLVERLRQGFPNLPQKA